MLDDVLSNVRDLMRANYDLVFLQGLGDHELGAHVAVQEPAVGSQRGNYQDSQRLPATGASGARSTSASASSKQQPTVLVTGAVSADRQEVRLPVVAGRRFCCVQPAARQTPQQHNKHTFR